MSFKTVLFQKNTYEKEFLLKKKKLCLKLLNDNQNFK